jgi:hypothetical protein
MTTKAQLREVVADALLGVTDAGDSVYTPRDWHTYEGEYPVILVSAPREEKESFGERGSVEFLVVATIRIVAKTEMPAFSGDYGAEAAEGAVEQIQAQIERGVIGAPQLRQLVSQFVSVRSEIAVSAAGEKHRAELAMDVALEFYQGPEDFSPSVGLPLTEIAINLDLQNRFDPTGTYANPPWPTQVTSAPRVAGPDGRDEGALVITLPTE